MEHARKMILVPADTVHKLQQNETIQDKTLSNLDAEMRKVLQSNSLDSVKWQNYQQVLNRYLHFVREARQPIALEPRGVDVTTDMDHVIKPDDKIISQMEFGEITASLPKSLRSKGELLLRRIAKAQNIKWDQFGRVTINNNDIPNSNIIDLVGDVLRARQKSSNPRGYQRFAIALREINVPLEFIGNPERAKVIFGAETSPVRAPVRGKGSKKQAITPYPSDDGDDETTYLPPTRRLSWAKLPR